MTTLTLPRAVDSAPDASGVYLVLKRASVSGATQLMTGDVVETATGAAVAHIGSFGLPSASGRLKSADQGFIEPYLPAGCGQRITVTYCKPVGTEAGVAHTGGLPTVTDPSSGSCLSTTSQTTGRGGRSRWWATRPRRPGPQRTESLNPEQRRARGRVPPCEAVQAPTG
ncbi:hypothetical protein OG978_38430 [Streptomyces sp. NBC_01591]|uniref:hypothetical protein n=1 Tax=Streptomyces sp. NBC_01591 TaxID=2975888 RepID=UPI002DDC5CD2|nr:hypothetical protein [Streptomyces sp. NBC_01591]WSD72739.1 hypothetical protein OG978_38430 [Streptomyces sp. NBC_01591]